MRVRSSGGIILNESNPVTTWSTTHPAPIYLGNYYYKYCEGFARIVDQPKRSWLRYPSGARRQAMKPVEHLKWGAKGGRDLVTVRTSASNWQSNSASNVIQGWYTSPSGISQDVGTLVLARALALFPSIDSAFSEAWEQKRPRLSNRLNLSVFAWELGEIRQMFEIIPYKHLKKMTMNPYRQWVPVKSWTDAIKLGNSGHLNYNFGWRPFLSDVQKTLERLESWQDTLRKYIARADRDLRLVRRPEEVTVDWQGEVLAPDPNLTLMVDVNFIVRFASTFELAYSLPIYGEYERELRAVLDIFGLNCTLANLWAILPWSFVVDWFWNVGGWLETFATDWYEPWIDLHQACVSRHCSGTVSVGFRDPYGGAIHEGVTVSFSHYLRKVGLPKFDGSTDPLDADKIRLGSSLLLSLFL